MRSAYVFALVLPLATARPMISETTTYTLSSDSEGVEVKTEGSGVAGGFQHSDGLVGLSVSVSADGQDASPKDDIVVSTEDEGLPLTPPDPEPARQPSTGPVESKSEDAERPPHSDMIGHWELEGSFNSDDWEEGDEPYTRVNRDAFFEGNEVDDEDEENDDFNEVWSSFPESHDKPNTRYGGSRKKITFSAESTQQGNERKKSKTEDYAPAPASDSESNPQHVDGANESKTDERARPATDAKESTTEPDQSLNEISWEETFESSESLRSGSTPRYGDEPKKSKADERVQPPASSYKPTTEDYEDYDILSNEILGEEELRFIAELRAGRIPHAFRPKKSKADEEAQGDSDEEHGPQDDYSPSETEKDEVVIHTSTIYIDPTSKPKLELNSMPSEWTTEVKVVEAPSSVAAAPYNFTTAPSNITTAPYNTTAAPYNTTAAPSTITMNPSSATKPVSQPRETSIRETTEAAPAAPPSIVAQPVPLPSQTSVESKTEEHTADSTDADKTSDKPGDKPGEKPGEEDTIDEDAEFPANPTDEQYRNYVLNLHNNVRLVHKATKLEWSPEQEEIVRGWVGACKYHHPDMTTGLGGDAQNIAWQSGSGSDHPLKAVNASFGDWYYSESLNYNYETHEKLDPKGVPVGHFVNIVKKRHAKVACASHFCEKLYFDDDRDGVVRTAKKATYAEKATYTACNFVRVEAPIPTWEELGALKKWDKPTRPTDTVPGPRKAGWTKVA